MRSTVLTLLLPAVVIVLGCASWARAGMPSIGLDDMARLRLEAISFFLLCLLLSSWAIQRIWNGLRGDFPRLPRLSYRRACGLVTLWGLLFLLVLTMISGARELMTPGAWTKQGLTFKVATVSPDVGTLSNVDISTRMLGLERLRAVLWTYARHHEGHLPSDVSVPEIPQDVWLVPNSAGAEMFYVYRPGAVADRGTDLVAFEPGVFGLERLVLRSDGRIVTWTDDQLRAALSTEKGGR